MASFRDVAGATPVFLVGDPVLPDRFVRTDVEFGSGDEKHPLILVGPNLGPKLYAASFRGLDLRPVVG